MASAPSAPGFRHLGVLLFALLAVASIGALALTQELRSRPDVVNSVRVESDDGSTARIRFRLTEPEPRATIEIVARGGEVVGRPLDRQPLGAGRTRVRWDGRVAGGEPAPPGRYRVRFDFEELDRRAFLPGRIRIEEQR